MTRRAFLAGAAGALCAGPIALHPTDAALAGEIAAALGDEAARRAEAQRAAEAVPMPRPAPVPPASTPAPRSTLWLRRIGGEEIATRFRDADSYDRAAVARLSWFLRDIADHDRAVWMEPRLFDLLAAVQGGLSAVNGAAVPLIVTSAYRTPQHNALIETAARNSLHLYGYAADIMAPPFSPRAVALAASFLAGGGIGLYERFTHLDVGAIRSWTGPQSPPRPLPAAE